MDKPISRKAHGLTDYSYVPSILASPSVAGFEDEPGAVLATRLLASGILISSFFTRAEWGVVKRMPYKNHLALDTLGGLTALASPWLFGFSHNKKARNALLFFGAFGLIAGNLSKPEEM